MKYHQNALLVIFLAAMVSVVPLGCGRESDARDGLTIAVSIPPQAFVVERIGGAHVRIITLLQPGESPHTFQPSDYQVSELLKARIYFRIGVPFERGKWADAVTGAQDGMTVVDVREGMTLRAMTGHGHEGHEMEGDEHGHEDMDPHVWLAPGLLKIQARTVARILAEAAPEFEDAFRSSLEALLTDLDRLDAEIRELLGPFEGKRIYLYHPAWGYFCDAYGLEQAAVEIEGKEPSDEELTRLQERIRADGARVLFVQPQIAGQSARAVAEALGVELKTLDPMAGDPLSNLLEVAEIVARSFP